MNKIVVVNKSEEDMESKGVVNAEGVVIEAPI